MSTHLEWLNRNALRGYPLREDSRRQALNTGWTLPDFLLADISLTVPEADQGLYLSAVTISGRIVSVVIASIKTGQSVAVASATKDIDPSYARVDIHPMIPGVSGAVTFGPIFDPQNFEILQQALGIHYFGFGVRLETRTFIDTGVFPVTSISTPGGVKLTGSVALEGSDSIVISSSQGEDNGDPITLLLISLSNPTKFLSPCEERTTPCECDVMPIHSINGVVGDEDGRITIEIVDENGNVYLLESSVLSFLISRSGEALCERPAMPDQYGRLPGATGSYDQDLPPTNSFQAEGDTTFPDPVL